MAQGMTSPLYTRDILRLAASIPYLVRFDELEDAVECRSPTCGSRAAVSVELDDDGRVVAFRQAVEACAFGQASAALMGANAAGRDAGEIRAAIGAIETWLSGSDPEPWPGFAALDPARARKGRHGAILLPFRALLAAMGNAR